MQLATLSLSWTSAVLLLAYTEPMAVVTTRSQWVHINMSTTLTAASFLWLGSCRMGPYLTPNMTPLIICIISSTIVSFPLAPPTSGCTTALTWNCWTSGCGRLPITVCMLTPCYACPSQAEYGQLHSASHLQPWGRWARIWGKEVNIKWADWWWVSFKLVYCVTTTHISTCYILLLLLYTMLSTEKYKNILKLLWLHPYSQLQLPWTW